MGTINAPLSPGLKMRIAGALAVPVAAAMLAAPAARAITGEEMCKAMHWPMPLPPTVGYGIDRTMNDSVLMCFDNMVATAPDGHDVMNDTIDKSPSLWRVTSMSPPAGTLENRDQKISLSVVRDDNPLP